MYNGLSKYIFSIFDISWKCVCAWLNSEINSWKFGHPKCSLNIKSFHHLKIFLQIYKFKFYLFFMKCMFFVHSESCDSDVKTRKKIHIVFQVKHDVEVGTFKCKCWTFTFKKLSKKSGKCPFFSIFFVRYLCSRSCLRHQIYFIIFVQKNFFHEKS